MGVLRTVEVGVDVPAANSSASPGLVSARTDGPPFRAVLERMRARIAGPVPVAAQPEGGVPNSPMRAPAAGLPSPHPRTDNGGDGSEQPSALSAAEETENRTPARIDDGSAGTGRERTPGASPRWSFRPRTSHRTPGPPGPTSALNFFRHPPPRAVSAELHEAGVLAAASVASARSATQAQSNVGAASADADGVSVDGAGQAAQENQVDVAVGVVVEMAGGGIERALAVVSHVREAEETGESLSTAYGLLHKGTAQEQPTAPLTTELTDHDRAASQMSLLPDRRQRDAANTDGQSAASGSSDPSAARGLPLEHLQPVKSHAVPRAVVARSVAWARESSSAPVAQSPQVQAVRTAPAPQIRGPSVAVGAKAMGPIRATMLAETRESAVVLPPGRLATENSGSAKDAPLRATSNVPVGRYARSSSPPAEVQLRARPSAAPRTRSSGGVVSQAAPLPRAASRSASVDPDSTTAVSRSSGPAASNPAVSDAGLSGAVVSSRVASAPAVSASTISARAVSGESAPSAVAGVPSTAASQTALAAAAYESSSNSSASPQSSGKATPPEQQKLIASPTDGAAPAEGSAAVDGSSSHHSSRRPPAAATTLLLHRPPPPASPITAPPSSGSGAQEIIPLSLDPDVAGLLRARAGQPLAGSSHAAALSLGPQEPEPEATHQPATGPSTAGRGGTDAAIRHALGGRTGLAKTTGLADSGAGQPQVVEIVSQPALVVEESMSAPPRSGVPQDTGKPGVETPVVPVAQPNIGGAQAQRDKVLSLQRVGGAADLAEVVERVPEGRITQALRLAVQSGVKRVSLRLDPPGLGKVVINVEVVKGDAKVRIVTETSAGSELLSSRADDLRQSLNERGLSLGEFSVKADAGESRQGKGEASPGETAADTGDRGGRRRKRRGPAESDRADPQRQSENKRAEQGGVDIVA